MVALSSFNSFLGYVEEGENLQNKAVHIFHTCVRKYAGFKLCINRCLQKTYLKLAKKISSKFWLYGQNNLALTNFHILRFQIHVENTALKFYFLCGYRSNLYPLTSTVVLHKGKTHCWNYKFWLKTLRGVSLYALLWLPKLWKYIIFMYLCWNSVPDACIAPNAWGISWKWIPCILCVFVPSTKNGMGWVKNAGSSIVARG